MVSFAGTVSAGSNLRGMWGPEVDSDRRRRGIIKTTHPWTSSPPEESMSLRQRRMYIIAAARLSTDTKLEWYLEGYVQDYAELSRDVHIHFCGSR
jgi:hypothetical protein